MVRNCRRRCTRKRRREVLSESRMRKICMSGSMSVAPCKRVELSRLRWRPRQSLASSRVPSLAWCPVTATAKRRQGGGRPECSERENSPEIERDRSSRPCRSKGKAESQAAPERVAGRLPGFVPPACNQGDQREQGRSIRFKRKFVGPDKPTR